MTELNSIKAGDRVLVKIGRNLIECEALAVSPVGVTVRSLSTGREFTTARVEEVVGRGEAPEPEAPAVGTPADGKPADEPAAEEPAPEAPADEKPADEESTDQQPADETPVADGGEKPRKKLSLLNARELVKLAKDRGLWMPTGCRTPEQSLYGAFFLEIKNAEKPRIRKSAERGKFELA